MSRRLLLLATVLLAALSCRKKDAFEPIDCQYFVEVTAEQRFTFDQLMEQIKLDWSATIETVDSQWGVDEILEANKDDIDMEAFKKGEPAYDRIMEAADKLKIPADWTPKSPVFLFHAKDDSFVPRLSADALAERWKAAGADVQYTVYDTDLHLDTFFLMEVDFVQQLP
jgi:acetyl esterase/lipase